MYDIMEYFYFGNQNYYFNDKFDYDNFRDFIYIYIINNHYGYDISILDYCLNVLIKNNFSMPQSFDQYFKFASYIPINLLKKYVQIFEPNRFKFIILDNIKEKLYYEKIINMIISDSCFCDNYNALKIPDSSFDKRYTKFNLTLDEVSLVLKKYNVYPEKIHHYEIQKICDNNDKLLFNFSN